MTEDDFRQRDAFAGEAMSRLMDAPALPLHELAEQVRTAVREIPVTKRTRASVEALGEVEDRLRVGITRGEIARYAYDMAEVMLEERARRGR